MFEYTVEIIFKYKKNYEYLEIKANCRKEALVIALNRVSNPNINSVLILERI